MKAILFLLIFLATHTGLAQQIVSGTVVDAENREVIAGATVYINNSTIRTSSNKEGYYKLRLPGEGTYELVVSAIGYELAVQEIKTSGMVKQDMILQRKTTEIEEIAISPFLKDGWKDWGAYFTETFIGTSAFSKQTNILNPEVLRFRYDKVNKVLTVLADQPLKISNRALGYDIDYDLHAYSMNFDTKYLYFEGFASFQERKRVSRKTRKNREEAYRSSLMRFIRSTYTDSWDKDGYEVRELMRVYNEERAYADSVLKVINRRVFNDFYGSWTSYYASHNKYNADSVSNFRRILSQPAVYSILGRQLTSTQIVSSNQAPGQRELSYENYLYIQHPGIMYEDAYFMWNSKADESSQLTLLPGSSVWIDALGNFSPPISWILEGYWAWYNKLGTMLPLDYGL